MEEKDQLSNVFLVFVASTIVMIAAVVMFLTQMIPNVSMDSQYIILRALGFLYIFAILVLVFRLWFFHQVSKLAKSMRFEIITSIFHQPKIEGYYKEHFWQIHYRSKDAGKNPSFIRTYVKLIFKKEMRFDQKKLEKINKRYGGYNIICAKHIIRPSKNYLLLKVSPYIFEKRKIYELMDYLLQIYKDSRIK
jgi:hypothetical protein